jgi:hypothetical protein
MKNLIPLLLLVCIPVHVSGFDGSQFQGAWLQNGIRWINAPRDINPRLQSGEAAVLFFEEDHKFALIYCAVGRVPKEYMNISHGDPRGVFIGKWDVHGDEIAIEYRLVDRTIQLKGEKLPGPIQSATIKASHDILNFNGKTFRRSRELDKSAAEVMSGTP